MTTSPYDSLPVGNNDISSENTLEYVEVDMQQLQAMSEAASEAAAKNEPALSAAAADADTPEAKITSAETIAANTAASETSAAEADEPAQPQAPDAAKSPVAKVPAAMQSPASNTRSALQTQPQPQATPPKPAVAPPKSAAKTVPFENAPQYSRINIKNLLGRCEYILPFEESLLVPDTMPDMQNVLFAEGRVDLTRPEKASYGKDDFLSGDITVYTVCSPVSPDLVSPASGPAAYSSSPIDVVKSSIPFKTDKCWDKALGDNFRVSLSVKSLTADIINERKFTVKGELLIKITEIADKELRVFKSSDDDRLITAAGKAIATDLVHEDTETTEISQEITVRDDLPSPVKILKEDIDISEIHRQITSGKLVINASIHSRVLYIGETDSGDMKTASLTSKTDFTQFIAMDNNADADMMHIGFNDGSLKINIENKDKFLLQGNVITHIQVYENKEVNTVTDAYHKARDIHFDPDTKKLCAVRGTVSGEISAREVVNLSEAAGKTESLLCGSCFVSSISGSREKGRIIIEGSMPVKLLAMDDNGLPFTIEHTVPVRGSLEMPSAVSDDITDIYVDTDVKEFWFDGINARQVEINTSLNIKVWIAGEENFCTIENLCFAETAEPAKHIPMAVYVVGSGDTLWDVAKRYRSDIDALASLNELDPQKPLPEGAKLFITK